MAYEYAVILNIWP